MAKSKNARHVMAFIQTIKDDWKGAFRKFPDLTILALKDEKVVSAIEKRFRDQASIKNVRQLDYDFYTGLFNLVFEFSAGLTDLGTSSSNAFLAILDSNGKVIAVVDPFDPLQPNKFVPPLPKESEQPFVLDRPSVTRDLTFSGEQLYPVQVRSHIFFERLKVSGGFGRATNASFCTYQTWNPFGPPAGDYYYDDCGFDDPTVFA